MSEQISFLFFFDILIYLVKLGFFPTHVLRQLPSALAELMILEMVRGVGR